MTRAALAFTLLSLGASCTGPDPFPCLQSIGSPSRPQVPVFLTGARATVPLELQAVTICPRGNPIATNAVSEVTDPLGRSVAHTNTGPMSSDVNGYSTAVDFVPLTPGVHLVSVRFEPGLGIVQREVQVALDRSADRPLMTVQPRGPCLAVDLVGTTVVCRRSDEVEVFRDGARVQTIRGRNLAVGGATGWTWLDGEVSRWTDPGTGPLLGLSIDAGVPDVRSSSHAASDERLYVVGDSRVYSVEATDGGLTVAPPVTVPVGPAAATSGVVLIEPGLLGYATDGSVCVVQVAPTVAVACRDILLSVHGADGEGLWLRGVSDSSVGVFRFASSLGPSVAFLPSRATVLQDTGGPVPVFTWNGRVVVPRADDFTLDAWVPPGGMTVARSGATPRVVWLQAADDEVAVYRRGR